MERIIKEIHEMVGVKGISHYTHGDQGQFIAITPKKTVQGGRRTFLGELGEILEEKGFKVSRSPLPKPKEAPKPRMQRFIEGLKARLSRARKPDQETLERIIEAERSGPHQKGPIFVDDAEGSFQNQPFACIDAEKSGQQYRIDVVYREPKTPEGKSTHEIRVSDERRFNKTPNQDYAALVAKMQKLTH